MIRLPKNILNAEREVIADYLLHNYSIIEITNSLAEVLQNKENEDKIIITSEQLRRYFKVRGTKDIFFEKENRGRKPLTEAAVKTAKEREELFDNKSLFAITEKENV